MPGYTTENRDYRTAASTTRSKVDKGKKKKRKKVVRDNTFKDFLSMGDK